MARTLIGNIKGPKGEQGIQGIQGIQGPKGDKGDTPTKGVDYFTPADISSLKIPNVNNTKNDSTTNTYSCDYINKLAGVVLYENSSGNSGTITLNETSINFSSLEIFYCTNDSSNYVGSIKISDPNEKFGSLIYTLSSPDGASIYFKLKNIYIVDTIITNFETRYSDSTFTSSITQNNVNHIYITKVVGYR